jgi:hypothetical protein
MRITILGKRWLLCFVPWIDAKRSRGECDDPTTPNKEIRVLDKLKGEERLEVLIHEQLHAANWHIDEQFVTQFAQDLARNLTKLGYHDGTE